MKKLLATIVAALSLFSAVGPAAAKDENLNADFVTLEKSYIPPLFFTSAKAMGPTMASMKDYKANWAAFKDTYYNYRPDYANWQKYFDDIDAAIKTADAIVANAAVNKDPAMLPPAHDALEQARLTMLELRPRNGFPKFITDKMTVFHEPMEVIVLSVKGLTLDQVTPEFKEQLRAEYAVALKAWNAVERCPVDADEWFLTEAQSMALNKYMASTRSNMDNLGAALDADDNANIVKYGFALKAPFVEAYKIFGNFSKYVPAQ